MEAAGLQRTLVLIRHAKSSWDTPAKDHDRPLSGRGRRDADALGSWLAAQGLRPELVLCSTATRTRETWSRAGAVGGLAGELRYQPEIYQAWVPELLDLVRAVPEDTETLVLVGHAPGVPDLVEHLCRRTPDGPWRQLEEKFPTSGVALVDVPTSWRNLGKGRAELRTFAVPRG